MVAIWVPWPTLQESTFPFSSNLGILGSGVIRNEQTHPRFSPLTQGLDHPRWTT